MSVLKALTRKFVLRADCDLDAIAHRLPPSVTGADLYALCSDAMLHAIKRCIATGAQVPEVTGDDFAAALLQFMPSVSINELQRYEAIAAQYAPSSAPMSSSS